MSGIGESSYGQTCRPASGSQIGAPPFAQEGTTINYSFTLTIADLPGACAAIVTDVDFFTPDIFSTGGGDPCDNEGLELPHSNQLLNPGDLLRFSAVDTGMPNCAAASDVNCEIVVPGLVYIVDPADVVNDALPVSGCWEGLAQPGNFTVTASQEVETTFLNPDIDVEKFADITRVCEGQDTDVTYSYTVTTGAGDVAINNISATDDTCGPLVRGDDTPGNNDNTLELGEVWNFTCNDTIDGETTNTVTVTGNDVILGRTVSDTDVLTITANPPPTCVVDPPTDRVCENSGDTVEFCVVPSGGTPPYTFNWTGPGGFVATTECITVGVGGEYCATVTDSLGCTTEAPCCATLEINENPTCVIDPPISQVCADVGETVEFCVVPSGGAPPYTFSWTGPGGFTASTQCITVGVAGEYCATVTDSLGCTTQQPCCATLTFNPPPVAEPFGDEACEGEPAQVCVAVTGGRPPYDVCWFDSKGNQLDCCEDIPAGGQCCLNVSTQDPGNFDYTAVVTDDNGCTTEATARLDVFPNRLVTVPDVDICEGEPLEICATVAGGTPPYNVTWKDSDGNVLDSCVVSVDNGQCCIIVASEGEYCANVVDANGCTGTDCGILTVNTADCIATAEPDKICEGESAEICVSPTGDRPPFTVQIYNQAGALMQTCNAVPNGGECCVTVSPPPGSYTFHAVITDASGCVFGSPTNGECQVDLEVNENPECVVSPDPADICEGESIELCADATGGRPPYSFLWSNGATTQCITVSPAADTVYTVTVTDDNGCETSCERLVDVHQNPTCEITSTGGNCPQTLTVNVTGGRPPYSFLWSTGETTASIIVSTSGVYCVTVTDDNGCVGDCCFTVDCPAGEGCTPGYWKQEHHFDDWTDPFDPDDLFSEHFEDAFPGKTLLQVLSQPASTPPGPNALNSLGRHTVAAVLNAASADVDYAFSVQEVIDMFNAVFPGTPEEYNDLKNIFAGENEQGCPINGNSDGNADGFVDGLDLADLLSNWGGKGAGDVNQDGIVNGADLAQLLANWGQ